MNAKQLRRIPKDADLSQIHPDLRSMAVPISALSGHPDNPRLHPDANRKAIAGSLRKYQQRKPVVANLTSQGLRIEAGHGVYGEMLAAGAQYIAVTIVEDDPVTELGYMIADNRSGDLSEDDPAKLAAVLKQLIDAGEDVEEVGWDDATVQALLKSGSGSSDGSEPPEPQIDRAAELQKVWGTAAGQVWEIPSKTVPGRCHRVVCGDCRNAADVARLLDGQKVNVAFTSPPYASQRKYDEESGFLPIKPDAYVEWFEAVQANVRQHLAPDGSWFVNIKEHCEDGQRHLYVKDLTIAHVRQWGWRFVDEFCWKRKGVPGGWEYRFKNEWEPVFHFSMSDPKCNKYAVGVQSEQCFDVTSRKTKASASVFDCNAENGKEMKSGLALPGNVVEINGQTESEHNAGFPVGLPLWFIKAYSDPGDIIFDPFMGSWTTGMAAEREGRISYGMELSPKYLAVQLQRASDAGLSPRLVRLGER